MVSAASFFSFSDQIIFQLLIGMTEHVSSILNSDTHGNSKCLSQVEMGKEARNAQCVWEFITKLQFNLEKILQHEFLLVVVRYLFIFRDVRSWSNFLLVRNCTFFFCNFWGTHAPISPISWFCIHILCNNQSSVVFYNNLPRQTNKLHCS